MSNYFQEVFNSHVSASAGVADAATEDIWNIKIGLHKIIEKVCGTTRAPLLASWNLVVEWARGKGHCCQAESFQGLEDWYRH